MTVEVLKVKVLKILLLISITIDSLLIILSLQLTPCLLCTVTMVTGVVRHVVIVLVTLYLILVSLLT